VFYLFRGFIFLKNHSSSLFSIQTLGIFLRDIFVVLGKIKMMFRGKNKYLWESLKNSE